MARILIFLGVLASVRFGCHVKTSVLVNDVKGKRRTTARRRSTCYRYRTPNNKDVLVRELSEPYGFSCSALRLLVVVTAGLPNGCFAEGNIENSILLDFSKEGFYQLSLAG
jgi:hypothetical protein